MGDKNIRLKSSNNEGGFDYLYPATKSNIVDVNGKNLDDTLTEVTAQLAHTKSKLTHQPTTEKKPVVTVIFDDGWYEDYTIMYPYFKEKGIVGSTALVTDFINTPSYMDWNQINEMKNAGWEFTSHTVTHPDLSAQTYERIEEELKVSKEILQQNGLKIESIVYPLNRYNKDVLELAQKYYDYAFAKPEEVGNTEPFDQFAINRITLERPLSHNKSAIDNAIANNEWIVFMGHGMYFRESKYPDGTIWPGKWDSNIQNAKDNIEYCLGLGIDFNTATEVMKERGNSITLGDYNLSDSHFMLSKTGKISTSTAMETVELLNYTDGGVTSTTPLSAFEKNKTSIHTIMAVDSAGFPSSGGTLTTHNFGDRALSGELSHQLWIPSGETVIYLRRWNSSSKTWNSFVKIASTDTVDPNNKYVRNVILTGIQVPEIPANGYSFINIDVEGVQGRSPIVINCHYNGLGAVVDVSARATTTGKVVLVFRNYGSTIYTSKTKDFTLSYSMP